MNLKYGALFAGYGGLEMGAQAVLPGELAWYSEIDKGALKVLGHRFPGVPNLGDITTVDWSQVESVDVLTGGSPCQDLSHAGKRQGMTEGTRSNLWVAMREAIAQLRPSLVIWENVRGAYSACADSELGRCARCVDPDSLGGHDPRLRALGRVLGDLSELGYDTTWHGLRAADVGAPHGRFRVFIVARDASLATRRGSEQPHLGAATRPAAEPGEPVGALALLPSPRTSDTNGAGRHGDGGLDLRTAVSLLGTPTARNAPRSERFREGRTLTPCEVEDWGQYAIAINGWETLTRPAPAPTEPGPKGGPRLSAAFSEWMMGLPAGWVTDVPGITRNEALRALGNGVVPQQAAEAIRWMLAAASEVAA